MLSLSFYYRLQKVKSTNAEEDLIESLGDESAQFSNQDLKYKPECSTVKTSKTKSGNGKNW